MSELDQFDVSCVILQKKEKSNLKVTKSKASIENRPLLR